MGSLRCISVCLTFLVHYVPSLVDEIVRYWLSLSPTASAWDLNTTLTVAMIRASLTDPSPGCLVDAQKASINDPGLKGSMWVAKTILPRPVESNIKDALMSAIERLKGSEETYSDPPLEAVEGEWIGHRKGETDNAIKSGMSEAAKYAAMLQDTEGKATVIYFHGGQFYLKDPATHRLITHQLAKASGGRCFSVRYRLAPQCPFPGALLDGLVAYMSLLYPPTHSYHTAVPASEICITGDSAGGNLALALLQLILELKRQSQDGRARLMWHSHIRELPFPAGVAVLSPYIDLARALDSEVTNSQYDFLPPRSAPFTLFEPCGIWPVHPPRHLPYANENALLHPLVSPVTAQDWSGAPPVWICEGEECLSDAGMFLSKQLALQGVPVIFEQYGTMPHVFPIVFPDLLSSRKCLDQWGYFIRTLVDDPKAIETGAVKWLGASLTRVSFDIKDMISITLEELKEAMRLEIELWGLPPAAHPPT